MIDGARTKLQGIHFKLCHSGVFFVQAYLLQTHEMHFFCALPCAIGAGGIPEHGIYENVKTAVDKVLWGKARQVNKRLQAMVSITGLKPSSEVRQPVWRKAGLRKAFKLNEVRGSSPVLFSYCLLPGYVTLYHLLIVAHYPIKALRNISARLNIKLNQ